MLCAGCDTTGWVLPVSTEKSEYLINFLWLPDIKKNKYVAVFSGYNQSWRVRSSPKTIHTLPGETLVGRGLQPVVTRRLPLRGRLCAQRHRAETR